MQYTVVIEKSPRNFAAYVPDLPGCVATGTRKEVVRQIRQAIPFHIEDMREQGEPIPEPECPLRSWMCPADEMRPAESEMMLVSGTASVRQDYPSGLPAKENWRGNGEWPAAFLGDCASLVGDKVAPATCGDVPYIGLEHIGQGTLALLGAGTAKDVESTKTVFRAGDILFGKLRPYFRKVVRPRFDGICSTDIWVVRPRTGVDASYLFYLLASSPFVGFATQGAGGTRMPRAKWEHVSGFSFRLPSIDEQRAIAQILGALDDKIELNRRMSATLESSLKAMFQSWFERSKKRVPEGWAVKSLDDIAHFQNGLALQKHRPENDEGRLPVLKIAQLRSGILDGNECATSNIPTSCIVEDGDVIFSWSGSLMAKIWCGGRAALNQHLFKVTSVDHRSWFIFGWLQQHMRTFQAIAADKATTMGHIRRQHLREAKCVVPGDEVLTAADGICVPLHEQLIHAKVESRNLAQLRDALLPKLLSGEVRIRDADKIAEDAT